MFDSLIIFGIDFSIIGVLLSGLIAFVSSKNSRAASWVLSAAGIFGALGSIAFLLSGQNGVIIAGPFAFAFGFSLTLTLLSAIFFALLSVVIAVIGVYSSSYLAHYTKTYDIKIVQLLTAVFVLGMQGVLLAGNVIGFMFFWETMSLSSFFLVMTERTPEAIHAAFQYFIMTHLGAMALFGAFLILGHGELSTPVLGLFASSSASHAALVGASLLFLFGFGSKAGLVPLHVWLPEAHPQAPSHVSALMSGLMLKMAVYGFLVTVVSVPAAPWYALLVIAVGAISAVYGVLYAIVETDIKRVLAYSSIENMGLIFMMLGTSLYFGINSGLGRLALLLAIFHAINHALFKSGLFLSAGTIIREVHTKSMEKMGGLAQRMPLFSFLFLILALAAAALPPFGTFYGEWGFMHTMVSGLSLGSLDVAGRALLVALLSVAAFVGGLAVFAMVKLFAIPMLGAPRTAHAEHAQKPDARTLFPLVILALAITATGFGARTIMNNLAGGLMYESVYGPVQKAPPIDSSMILFMCALVLLIAYAARKLMSARVAERVYQTWNCGQPIDAGMEYTATAFSSPLRFFFRFMLRTNKAVVVTPVVATNPWIAERTYKLDLRSVWYERVYHPVAKALHYVNTWARKIQSGRIQLYLLLLFAALVITLMIAL